MKKSNLVKFDLDLYEEVLDNGLRVFIVPKENVNGIYVTFSTKFGSINQEFIPIKEKKYKKFPLGIAHFLEHKMFEQENGKDPFTFYSERGCDSNANTSNYKTTYLFSGANAFEENLNFLLDYVQSPYFTDENVEKEKGIIEQELKMYEDNPFSRMYDGIIYNTFVKHPIKYPIGGTKEDVYKITKEDLYKCYKTYYHPSNMFLVITGNVDPKETLEIIKVNQELKKFDKKFEIKEKIYDEPDTPAKTFEKIKMDVELPKLALSYKINFSDLKMPIPDIRSYLSILLDIKFGSTSSINEELKEKKLITHDIETTLISTDKHIAIILMAETDSEDEVINRLSGELSNLNITSEDLERKKKVRKSGCIYRSDSIYSINNKIMSNIINYDKVILDEYKKIDSITMSNMNKIIKYITLDNKSVYIVEKA